jgi:hypothetical protein
VTSTLEPDLEEPRRRRPTVGGVLALIVVLAIAGFWVYAFTIAPDTKADALRDETFTDRLNAHCAVADDQLDALPRAMAADTPTERARSVDASNVVVEDLTVALRDEAADASGRDRELLDQWLADWDTYLDYRQRYADALRSGDEDATFVVPARSGGQITETMDGFSRVNDLYDCLVPLDV